MLIKGIKEKINEQINFIYRNIYWQDKFINVHINKGSISPDYGRMIFALHSLSRAYKYHFINEDQKKDLHDLFLNIYKKSKDNKSNNDDSIYVDIYGIGLLNNFNIQNDTCLISFIKSDHETLYNYPVGMYIYVSLYFDYEDLVIKFPFAEAIKNKCLQILEYVLHSSLVDGYKAFHFSDVSLWSENISKDLYDKNIEIMEKLFDRDVSDVESYVSGITSSMEHFSRIGDMVNLQRGFDFLENRKLSRYKNYINPKYKDIAETIYTEGIDSQYICLDTSSHLLNTYLNLYENNK